jgi:hypothetical protein
MADRMTSCKARQYSDQMLCGTCNLAWDVNDPEPPECRIPDTAPEELEMHVRNAVFALNSAIEKATKAGVRVEVDSEYIYDCGKLQRPFVTPIFLKEL